ncbi:MAG: DoxX family protein [Pyrinomonadaceae bacterium]
MNSFLADWTPRVLSILRIIAGFLFLWHGSQKLFGFPPSQGGGGATGLMLVAGVLEFFGGLLLLLGLFTRPVAFILSGLMAAAYFMAHAPGGFLPIVNKGEPAVIYCFVFLYFAFAGGGAWSLDRLIWKKG